MQGFGKIPPVVSEEMRKRCKSKMVGGGNHIRADTTRSLGGHLGQVPKEIRPVVSEEMRYREKVYRRVDGRTDGRRTVPIWVKL